MSFDDTNLKKIYNRTASVIVDLCYNKKINESEMYLLLNILELIWLGSKGDDLIQALLEWQNSDKESEIDEIIKETLFEVSFDSDESLHEIAIMITELLASQKE